MIRSGIALMLALSIGFQSMARPATPDEIVAIDGVINTFIRGMTTGDARAVAETTIVPRVLRAQALQLDVDEATLYSSFKSNLQDFLRTIEINDISFANDNLNINDGATGRWTWMDYRFVIMVDGDALNVEHRTLAVEDAARWYLVRVDDQNLPFLVSLFPEIAFDNYGEAVINRVQPN